MPQFHLFPTTLRSAHLVADSPKQAFWSLELIEHQGRYSLRKTSGAGDRVLDRRTWQMRDLSEAVKIFERRVAAKLNPQRGSPRRYKKKAVAKKNSQRPRIHQTTKNRMEKN